MTLWKKKVDDLRQKTEAKKEKLAFFEEVLENSIDIYWELDLEGNYIEGLGAYIDVFGYSRDEILSMNSRDVIPKDDFPGLQKVFFDIISNKKTVSFEMSAIKKDNTVVPLEAKSWPLIENDKVVGTCGIARDISWRKKAEKELKDQEEKYRRMAENTNDVLWIWDLINRQYKYVSPSLKNMTGYDVAEMPYRTLDRIIMEDDRKIVEEVFSRSTDDYGVGSGNGKYPDFEKLEWREYHKDGHPFWAETTISIIRDDAGKAVEMVGSSRDISKQKAIEIELYRRNRFFETVMENLPIGLSLNRISDGIVSYSNKEAENIYGWKREEIENVDMFFEKTYPDPVERKEKKEMVMADIDSGDPSRMIWDNLSVITAKGERKTIRAQNIPLFDRDLMISTVEDITEIKQLEDRMGMVQKMESVATLAGSIARQFNTALSVMSGYLGIIKLETQDVSFINDYITPMVKSVKRMSVLTEQLLAYARGGKYQPGKISLSEVTRNVVSMFEQTFGPSVSLETDLSSRGVDVEADATQLQVAVSAILTNAIEAVEKEGRIVLTCKKEHMAEETAKRFPSMKNGDYVCLTVADNGMGMDEIDRSRMFEPFFTTKGHGRGLGMAAAYGIIQNHEGWVDVHSQIGKGTAVRVYLPAV